MNTILIILDGVSEEKIDLLNNETPLEYANTKTLDRIIKEGFHFKTKYHEKGFSPNSLNCIPRILGVEKANIPKHRAYLEALSCDIPLSQNDIVLRCNLISVKDNCIQSFNGKGLSTKEKKYLSEGLSIPKGLQYYHIGDYKNLLIIESSKNNLTLNDFKPHERIGDNLEEYLNEVSKIKKLKDFIELNEFNFNGVNYLYLPWGPSSKVKLPSFRSIHSKTCFSVSHAKIVKGICQAMNIETAILKKSTGDTDTDLREKLNSVLENKDTNEVIIAHINGTDEISHRKNLKEKISFIEKIDRNFIKPIYDKLSLYDRIIILSDHQTSSITGNHEEGYVDVITNRKYIDKNNLFK